MISIFARPVVPGVVLLLTAFAAAGIKTELLPVSATSDGAAFSMSSEGLSVPDTIEAFKKQTGLDVVYDAQSADRSAGGPAVVFDVAFTNLSQDDAIKELARALSLGIVRNNGPTRLSHTSYSGDNERRDTRFVEVSYISRNQTFPVSPRGRQSGLNVQFRFWNGKQPIDGPLKINVDEAVDEQGRSLKIQQRGPRGFDGDYGVRYWNDASVPLLLPDPLPKTIAKLRGSAVLLRPKTMLRLTIDGFDDRPMTADFAKGTITLGPPKRNGPAYELPITFTRGGMDEQIWQMLEQRINQLRSATVVRGPNGESLALNLNEWSNGDREMKIKSTVSRIDRDGNAGGGEPIAPASLRWDSVAETFEEATPFEFTNISIP